MTTRGKRGKERDRRSQTSTQNTQETPSRPVSTPTSSLSRPSPIAHPTSTPSTPISSHSCVFDLRDDEIWYNGSKLKNVKYRARHSRVMDTIAKTSWIYQHGADIEAKEYPKLWLCKVCHLSKRPGNSCFKATASSSATYHLKQEHDIVENPESRRSSTSSSMQSAITPFADAKYKKDLIDWLVRHDLPFELEVAEDT
jgi:hypothetical protein